MPRKKTPSPAPNSSQAKPTPASKPPVRPARPARVAVPSTKDLPPNDDLLEKEQPDEQVLAQTETSEEWNEISIEDPIEILEDPSLAMELSEDPVRLYLKEIGQIHLLDFRQRVSSGRAH